jgi:hypothetical protein
MSNTIVRVLMAVTCASTARQTVHEETSATCFNADDRTNSSSAIWCMIDSHNILYSDHNMIRIVRYLIDSYAE